MWDVALRYSAVGIEIVVALAIGYLLGRWLDGKLHTSPWLTVLFAIGGVGAAIKALVRAVKSANLEMQKPETPETTPEQEKR